MPLRQSLRLSTFYDNDVAISARCRSPNLETNEFEGENMVNYEISCAKTFPPHNTHYKRDENNKHMRANEDKKFLEVSGEIQFN